jgi:tight adherence protein B
VTIHLRSFTLLVLSVITLLLVAVPSLGQSALEVSLEGSRLAPDGTTTLTVSLTGSAAPESLTAEQVTVTEGGEPVSDINVEPVVVEGDQTRSTIMLVLDTSSSAEGATIAATREVAIELVESVMPAGVEVGLIRFSSAPELLLEPTDDLGLVTSTIEELEAAGGTALYDALTLGAYTLQERSGERRLVVFTDGEDTTSRTALDDALAAVEVVGAPVWMVALVTPVQDWSVLEQVSERTRGELLRVEEAAGLSEAFATVAQSLTNRFLISYVGSDLSSELDLAVTVAVGDASASFSGVLLNPRLESEVAIGPPPTVELFDAGPLGTPTVLYAALGVAFIALVLFLGVLFVPRGGRQASRTLRRGLTMTERRAADGNVSTGLTASGIGKRALQVIAATPKPKNYEEKLQVQLDRAGWQIRATEFIAMRLGAGLAGLVLLWALTGQLWFGVLSGLIGQFLPVVALSNARQRRLKRFMEQLPDTLQLLAGTLRSGYAILQAIDTIVKETEPPMSTEFQRVLTEARLGLPLEDSLEAMAERVDSDDFRWVVVAMNIQRQVGGNLAELLETVSETLRGREQTRRQIQVLSAEGKLSAIILVALPFLLLFYMLLTNPVYLAPLITSFFGIVMSVGAVVLIGIGVFWMTRMIKIDV